MEKQKGIPFIKPGTAYQSLRESGFDFSTAIGELIDNSIDAKAKRIEIIPKIVERKFEERSKPVSVITQIAVVDDGNGMDADKLNSCPQLGFLHAIIGKDLVVLELAQPTHLFRNANTRFFIPVPMEQATIKQPILI